MKRNNWILKNRDGFTLVEILLTVSIVAFLGGSLYATFAAGLKLERRAKESFSDLAESRLLFEQLYKDLGRTVMYDFRGSYPDRKSFAFAGEKLIFLIEDQGQLKWVRYRLAIATEGKIKETRLGIKTKRNVAVSNLTSTEESLLTLVREENDFVHFFDLTDTPQKTDVLSARVLSDGWKVSCAPSLGTMPKIEWESNWEKNFLPAAVRVSVSIKSRSSIAQKLTRDFILPSGGRDEP